MMQQIHSQSPHTPVTNTPTDTEQPSVLMLCLIMLHKDVNAQIKNYKCCSSNTKASILTNKINIAVYITLGRNL